MVRYAMADLRVEINCRRGGEDSRITIGCLRERRRDVEGCNLQKEFDACDRTTSKMRGFVSQDHIGGFSTKRECANTHK
jgi:hypothetical protein